MAAVTDIFSPRAHYVSYQRAHSPAVPHHELETLYTQSQHKTWGGLSIKRRRTSCVIRFRSPRPGWHLMWQEGCGITILRSRDRPRIADKARTRDCSCLLCEALIVPPHRSRSIVEDRARPRLNRRPKSRKCEK